MYKFNDLVSKEGIESKVNDYHIFSYYYPALKYGRVVKSPFRDDLKPSFGIFRTHDDKTLYKDLGTGEVGGAINFVSRLFNLGFKDAINKINADFNLGFMPYYTLNEIPKTKSIIQKVPNRPQKLLISVFKRLWQDYDINYWKMFGLSLEELKMSHTYPIKAFRIGEGRTILADKLAYSLDFYDDGDGIMMRKIYQPFSKTMKWRTNLTPLVVDGIKELPQTDINLIITKSRKDRLVLKHFNLSSISTNSETSFIPEQVFYDFTKRFNKIHILFDNDKTGINNAEKFANKYNLNILTIPKYWKVKDIAEFRFKYGELTTKNFIQAWNLK
jgi:hypothetical protein